MAYERLNLRNGDTLSAKHIAHIEDGIEAAHKSGAAIVCTSAGDVVTLDDASDQPIRGLRVFGRSEQASTTGKNLFGGDALADRLAEVAKAQKDTSAGTVYFTAENVSSAKIYTEFKPETQYTIILYGKNTNAEQNAVNLRVKYDTEGVNLTFNEKGKKSYCVYTTTKGRTVTEINGIYAYNATELDYSMCGIFEGVITLDQFEPYTGGAPSPSPEYPQEIVSVGDDGEISVEIVSKNLLGLPAVETSTNGFTIAPDGDGVVVSGKAEENKLTYLDLFKSKGAETLTWVPSNKKAVIRLRKNGEIVSGIGVRYVTKDGITKYGWEITSEEVRAINYIYIEYTPTVGDTSRNGLYTVQLEYGDAPTSYEPYKPIQSLPISTPNGLPGIPVSSGGNYTDSTGQAWVCDEIDFGRGVYVQRVSRIVWDGKNVKATARNSTSKNNMYYTDIPGVLSGTEYSSLIGVYCTHMTVTTFLQLFEKDIVGISAYPNQPRLAFGFGLGSPLTTVEQVNAWMAEQYAAGTPMTAVYQLAEPIETPLTEAELNAYKALHTNKPHTTVYTDEGAGVEVSYAADTKTYIDNKFAELAAAMVANV